MPTVTGVARRPCGKLESSGPLVITKRLVLAKHECVIVARAPADEYWLAAFEPASSSPDVQPAEHAGDLRFPLNLPLYRSGNVIIVAFLAAEPADDGTKPFYYMEPVGVTVKEFLTLDVDTWRSSHKAWNDAQDVPAALAAAFDPLWADVKVVVEGGEGKSGADDEGEGEGFVTDDENNTVEAELAFIQPQTVADDIDADAEDVNVEVLTNIDARTGLEKDNVKGVGGSEDEMESIEGSEDDEEEDEEDEAVEEDVGDE